MTPDLCTDAPGFDRSAFHGRFDADVVKFFQNHLTNSLRLRSTYRLLAGPLADPGDQQAIEWIGQQVQTQAAFLPHMDAFG